MFKKIINPFLNFLFPISCMSCHALLPPDDKYRVCPKCISSIKYISDGLYCHKCGKPLPSGGATCWRCKKERHYFEMSRSAVFYEGIIKDLIHQFKYRGAEHLKHFLARLLIDTAKTIPEILNCEIVIPVPLHRLKKFLRGYNQSELLAAIYSKELKKTLVKDVLIRKKFTKQQANLNREDRLKNVEGAFAVNNVSSIKGREVLIIDDVQTTSATLNQCAVVLKKSGCKKVYCLTIAHD